MQNTAMVSRSKSPPAVLVRHRRSTERGAAAVEFALVLPLFLMLLMGTIDYGYYFFSDQIVTNAAREGARTGTLVAPVGSPPTNGGIATTAAQAAVSAYLAGNNVGCAGGRITATAVPLTTGGLTTPAIDVVIVCNSVSLTGFTSIILPAHVQAHSVMRWQ
ncbi:MAG TPA: TadE/TadG family type IV pilus assembly protein [Polyangia bacterium]|jgi:Flp pilus assembly protein TadG|nr:TadE/TadG family type IV pilus assembly protein [Polyangia bacterium]